MSRNHSSREWSWILGPDGSPIYKAPLHGIHNSLFAFSCRCAEEDFNQSETEAFIRQGIERFGARRPVGDYEIGTQIKAGFLKVSNGATNLSIRPRYTARYSEAAARRAYEAHRTTEEDLRALSTATPPPDSASFLKAIFFPDDWVNIGLSKKRTATLVLSDWLNEPSFEKAEFLVPNRMTKKVGITASGETGRPRTQDNTSPRKWVILDFDTPPKEWQPSLMMELATFCGDLPAVVLSSANRGYHGWFCINGASIEAVTEFENKAIQLGADRVFMGEHSRMQLCRLPQAIRKENGKRQELLMWNPSVIEHPIPHPTQAPNSQPSQTKPNQTKPNQTNK